MGKIRLFIFWEKKSKKVTFFHFSELKIDVWLKMSVWSSKYRQFFSSIFKSFSDTILLKMKKTSKKVKKMIPINFYTTFGQNTTFHVLEKKVEKSHFFSFFETQNRCVTKNVSFVKKIRTIFFFDFLNHFLTPYCWN